MKKIVLILLILNIGLINSVNAQQDYNELYNRLEIEQGLKLLAEKAIVPFANENPQIPQATWDMVLENIDYTKFKQEYIDVLKTNYTTTEIKEIFLQNEMVESVNDTGIFLFEPNQVTADGLYDVGKRAGRDLVIQILNFFAK